MGLSRTDMTNLPLTTLTTTFEPLDANPALASKRQCEETPVIEEACTGNPYLNRVLADIKCFQENECCNKEALAEAWNALGLIRLHMQRNANEARKCHEQALRIYQSHQELSVPTAITLNDLAFCYEQLSQIDRALETYNKALRMFKDLNMTESNIRVEATLRSISRVCRK